MKLPPLVSASAGLVVLFGAAAAQRLTATQALPKGGFEAAQMTRYDLAAHHLESGELDQALRQLAPDPEEVLVIPTDLPPPDLKKGGRLPAGTFLYLGGLLTRRAKEAAQSGAAHRAEALLQMCYDLSRRLQSGSQSETPAERVLRLSVAHALERQATRTAQELAA